MGLKNYERYRTTFWVMVQLRDGTWIPDYASKKLGGLRDRHQAKSQANRIKEHILSGRSLARPTAIVKMTLKTEPEFAWTTDPKTYQEQCA